MRSKGGRDPRGRWQCREKTCRKQYTVKVGTVMQDSNIPLRYWVIAMHFWTASKKGIAAKQFQRMSGLSYKSALFLAHRVREAMADDLPASLTGVIEVDETYVGGKAPQAHQVPAREGRAGGPGDSQAEARARHQEGARGRAGGAWWEGARLPHGRALRAPTTARACWPWWPGLRARKLLNRNSAAL
jgi:hypothetical protein